MHPYSAVLPHHWIRNMGLWSFRTTYLTCNHNVSLVLEIKTLTAPDLQQATARRGRHPCKAKPLRPCHCTKSFFNPQIQSSSWATSAQLCIVLTTGSCPNSKQQSPNIELTYSYCDISVEYSPSPWWPSGKVFFKTRVNSTAEYNQKTLWILIYDKEERKNAYVAMTWILESFLLTVHRGEGEQQVNCILMGDFICKFPISVSLLNVVTKFWC